MIIKSLLGRASPAGECARLSVLILHRVLARPDPIFPHEVDARRFNAMCAWMRAWFNVLPLDQAAALLARGELPARSACITFDDGYADNHDVALPILQSHGLTATFFIATGFLDGGRMWNDTVIEAVRLARMPVLDMGHLGRHPVSTPQEKAGAIEAIILQIKYLPPQERLAAAAAVMDQARATVPDDLMMSSHQVRQLRRAGMQIGGHTVSHPILARLSDQDARAEVGAGKAFLEDLTGERVSLFAYPNGKPGEDYTPANVDMIRSMGFDAAVSTQRGVTGRSDDLFQIRRFTPWDRTRLRFGLRMLGNMRLT